MKKLFFLCLILLTGGALYTYYSEPQLRSDVPVIYWSTGANATRVQQIKLFHEWLVKNGHKTEDGRPAFELRMVNSASEGTKNIIQGVSGVACDLIDLQLNEHQFQKMGLLMDVTEKAKELGFTPETTYSALAPQMVIDGKQYCYPANVTVVSLWANVDTFEKYGLPKPPEQWTVEEFEAYGREFTAKANPPGERQQVFFCNSITSGVTAATGLRFLRVLHRSKGLADFNETLTACALDDARFSDTLKLFRKWTLEDRFMPSAADESSFSTEAGPGDATRSLFQKGKIGLLSIARFMLVRLRTMENPPRLSVSHFPYAEYLNSIITTRTVGVYAGSKHKDQAALFLAFLASKEYNEGFMTDADGLPPRPEFSRLDEFLRPSRFPNEWGAIDVEVNSAETIAIAHDYSPFTQFSTVDRAKKHAIELVMSRQATPEKAAKETAQKVNEDIAYSLKQNPGLQKHYDELVALQKKIEEYRAQNRPVPLEWIKNPFYKRYYVYKGWAAPEPKE